MNHSNSAMNKSNSVSQRNSTNSTNKIINKFGNVSISNKPLNQPIKRNFNSFNKPPNESSVDKSKLAIIKHKIDDIYRKYNEQNKTWKSSFIDLIEKGKLISYQEGNIIPIPLDSLGETCLKIDKFWIMWIENIKTNLKIDQLVSIVNHSINYIPNDKMIKTYFNRVINSLKINKDDIESYCLNNNISKPKDKFTFGNNNISGEYDYLLNKFKSYQLSNTKIKKENNRKSSVKIDIALNKVEENKNRIELSPFNSNRKTLPIFKSNIKIDNSFSSQKNIKEEEIESKPEPLTMADKEIPTETIEHNQLDTIKNNNTIISENQTKTSDKPLSLTKSNLNSIKSEKNIEIPINDEYSDSQTIKSNDKNILIQEENISLSITPNKKEEEVIKQTSFPDQDNTPLDSYEKHLKQMARKRKGEIKTEIIPFNKYNKEQEITQDQEEEANNSQDEDYSNSDKEVSPVRGRSKEKQKKKKSKKTKSKQAKSKSVSKKPKSKSKKSKKK